MGEGVQLLNRKELIARTVALLRGWSGSRRYGRRLEVPQAARDVSQRVLSHKFRDSTEIYGIMSGNLEGSDARFRSFGDVGISET
jgi:hypothetical protein